MAPPKDKEPPETQEGGKEGPARGVLADKLMSYGDHANHTWMDRLGETIDAWGIQRPEVEVVYKNLNITTQALVGSAGVPTVISPVVHLLKKLLRLSNLEEKELKLLDNVSGVLKPGRLTLLLGPPSSGKSTFMKALAGRLRDTEGLTSEGEIFFNGKPTSEFEHTRSVAYAGQMDNHEGNITVAETLDFAYICTAGTRGPRFDLPGELYKKKLEAKEAGARPDVEKGTARSSEEGSSDADGTPSSAEAASNAQSANGNGAASAANGAANGGDQHADGVIGRLKSKLSKRHSQRSHHSPAVPLDAFEETLAQVWGTGVKVDVVMKLLGVFHCRDTLVGNEMMRGISGGERKRLTSAEQMMGPRSVVMLDEMSTGLDSATLFTVIRWFSKWCHAAKTTMMISLLQPPPEVFQLFDDVLIFSAGQEIYHGPVQDAVPFFASLGFECPARKDIPSYLLEVTTAKGQHTYASRELRIKHNLPLDNSDFRKLSIAGKQNMLVPVGEMRRAFWERNEHGKVMAQEVLSAPQPKPSAHPNAVETSGAYPLTPLQCIAVASKRQVTLVLRDRVLLRGRIMQVTVISLLCGSLFYQLPVSLPGARSFFGFAFLVSLFINFGGFPQLPLTIEAKKVWFKHRSNGFLPAYAQGLSMGIAQIPLSILESIVLSLVLYFMVDLYQSAGHFFAFYVTAFSLSMSCSALFRFIGCVCPNMTIANAVGGLTLVTLIITSGFAIVHGDIPPWMIWAYWLSPFAWALRAFVVNEMMTPKWNDMPYPDNPTIGLGVGALQSFDFYLEDRWIWFNVAYQMALYVALTIAAILCLHFQIPEQPRATLPDEAAVAEARAMAEQHRQQLAAAREAANNAAAAANGNGNGNGNGKEAPLGTRLSDGAKSVEGGKSTAASEAGTPRQLGRSDTSARRKDGIEVDIDISSSLEFTPITLVFRDIGYTVPNPSYSRKAARAYQAASRQASRAGSTELPTLHIVTKDKEERSGHGASGSAGGGPLPADAEAKLAPAGSGALQAATQQQRSAAAQASAAAQLEMPLEAREKLQLLTDITGYAEPGVLTALMGGSGAGKTTLMDCLAGRKTVGEITGEISVNGHPKEQRTWSRVVGYCEQNDIHTPLQTVKEALMFSARLRLPTSVSDEKVRAYVDEVIDLVDMTDRMYSLVGQPGVSGLSVEQRKRLTIGVELVANPSVVFLDEPTSGLDARAAAIVMQAVRNVARNGRTVIVTIHQPSIEIFEAFDRLLLIQRGGRTTYFGPVGEHSEALISYLMSVPGTPDLIPGFNPATWMLEVTGGSMATMVEAVKVDWPQVYASSQLAADNRAHADTLVAEARAANEPPLHITQTYAQPFNVQVNWLLTKFNLMFWRNAPLNLTRIIMTFITAFIYAAVYWRQGQLPNPATIANIQAVMGIMYSSTNFQGMTNLMSIMPVVGYERIVFYRELGASMYNPFAYGIAIALVELPYLLLQALIFVPIMYWMVAFHASAAKFFYYLLMFIATVAFYSVFGQALVYVTPNQAVAQVLGGSLNFLFNIFNGFIITYPNMPKGWRWMNRLAPSTWIMYGLGISQLNQPEITMFYNGQQTNVLDFMEAGFGYYVNMTWWCLLIVLAYILFLRVISIISLRYTVKTFYRR